MPASDLPPGQKSAPTSQPAIAGTWKMAFKDEFDGKTLNPVWHTAQWWDQTLTAPKGELESYDATGATVSGGQLHLTARVDKRYHSPYVSGLVMTGGYRYATTPQKTFSFQYGYIEVKAKVPAGQGFWPAIWMMPASYHDSNGEIDVMEVLGSDPTKVYFTIHHLALNLYQQFTKVGADLSADFHIYGVDWEPDHVAWYLDGAAIGTCTNPSLIPHEPMYPIMNLAIGGDWGGPPDSSTRFPASMDVDYIRVWQPATK
jgi:beta-glucanase (GH16 family)